MLIKLPSIDPNVVEAEIIEFIKTRVQDMSKSGVIIGVSGGIDSAVTAVLCKKAVTELGKMILGYILPGDKLIENDQDTNDAVELCNKFDIGYSYVSLKHLIDVTELKINPSGIDKVVKGNMASRIRSNILHTVAELFNCLVCGTGNRDEDYGIGYYTLFGDGAVHISPIGNLSKRLVYQMAEHLDVTQNIIQKIPSARLEEGQTDIGDLGYGYDMVELVCEGLDQGLTEDQIISEIELLSSFTFNPEKFHRTKEGVFDIMIRHEMALKKAQLVSPEIAKVTLIY